MIIHNKYRHFQEVKDKTVIFIYIFLVTCPNGVTQPCWELGKTRVWKMNE